MSSLLELNTRVYNLSVFVVASRKLYRKIDVIAACYVFILMFFFLVCRHIIVRFCTLCDMRIERFTNGIDIINLIHNTCIIYTAQSVDTNVACQHDSFKF